MIHWFARVFLVFYAFSYDLFAFEMSYELMPCIPDEEISYFNRLWAQEVSVDLIENNVQEVDEEEGSPIGDQIRFFKIFSSEERTSCGYLSYWTIGKEALLDSLFLEKSYRRHGIGEQTLRQWESKLKQNGFVSISLTVLKENKAGVCLYEKLGYQIQSLVEETEKGYLMKKSIE